MSQVIAGEGRWVSVPAPRALAPFRNEAWQLLGPDWRAQILYHGYWKVYVAQVDPHADWVAMRIAPEAFDSFAAAQVWCAAALVEARYPPADADLCMISAAPPASRRRSGPR